MLNVLTSADAESIIRSDQFKFLVGEDKTPIMVHSSALAATSAQMDRLINGHMMEAGNRCAELPDLSVDDFTRFCEYAYRGDYATPAYTIDEAQLARKKSEDLAKISLADHSKQHPESAYTEFIDDLPPPAPAAPIDDWSGFLSKNGKTSKPSKRRIFRKEYRSRVYLPREQYEAETTDQFKPQSNTAEEQDFTPVFLAHARLYVFAHMRMADHLRALTLHKLHDALIAFQLFQSRVGDIIELARYAYSSADLPCRDDHGTTDPLKDLVVNYIASEFDIIGRTPVFVAFLEEGGEFVGDFWATVSERLL